MATQISKKRKFVADGVFYAELNELLNRELAEDGYSGVEVRVTPMRTEVIIKATRTQNVLGEKGRRIRELTSVVQKRFNFAPESVELYAEKVNERGLCAIAQCESLRYKLLGGLAVRRAAYGVLRFVMEAGAKGCEVVVSGKLRAARAKSMKFKDGYMVASGYPAIVYLDSAVRHVLLRQGVLGLKVKIMKNYDPTGRAGPKMPMPDVVKVLEPKEDEIMAPKVKESMISGGGANPPPPRSGSGEEEAEVLGALQGALTKADAALAARNTRGALAIYQQVLALLPGSPCLHAKVARLWLEAGRGQHALDSARAAVASAPELKGSDLLQLLGEAHLAAGNATEGVAALDSALVAAERDGEPGARLCEVKLHLAQGCIRGHAIHRFSRRGPP
ncbi:hypothetical protein FOA52_015887 [Chlamydomonas sp. UWO 241]|nr:hypothetical protein FOA52_015887 [Chlamydomonas sp. UWO 241]